MKLLIADDHTLFREALVQYIERSDPMSSVTLAKDLYQAVSILEQNPYQDLVILDLRMPGMKGMEGLKEVRERFPDLRVALMSGVAEPEDVRLGLDMGAVGYFPKTLSGKALLKGIQRVLDGEIFVPEGDKNTFMASHYDDQPTKPNAQVKAIDFTPRETDVLSYLVEGASNKEIANALELQIVTIKLHVRGICRKLNANNRTQAALKARAMGVEPASKNTV